MVQAGLVLEGGGMKGIYTAGVLDFFLDQKIEFPSVYGVSAGACHMCSYLSKQRGRAGDVGIDYADSRFYCSVESLLLTGNIFNTEMCYHTIPEYLYPYDNDAFVAYPGRAYSVATNIETGEAEYLRLRDMKRDIDMIRASASMPLVSRSVKIDGKRYLDGGIADAIPLRRAMSDGNRKNVVVMTKEEGFVRQPTPASQLALIKVRYLKYPKVYELMANRHIRYNQTLELIREQEALGNVLVIRPRNASGVGRLERDKERLRALYQEGYDDAMRRCEEIMTFLSEN